MKRKSVNRKAKVAKSQPSSPSALILSVEQLSKLRLLVQPDRWIDETFNLTAIGAFLLKERLIAPNPKRDSVKAFIVTSQGRQVIRDSR